MFHLYDQLAIKIRNTTRSSLVALGALWHIWQQTRVSLKVWLPDESKFLIKIPLTTCFKWQTIYLQPSGKIFVFKPHCKLLTACTPFWKNVVGWSSEIWGLKTLCCKFKHKYLFSSNGLFTSIECLLYATTFNGFWASLCWLLLSQILDLRWDQIGVRCGRKDNLGPFFSSCLLVEAQYKLTLWPRTNRCLGYILPDVFSSLLFLS